MNSQNPKPQDNSSNNNNTEFLYCKYLHNIKKLIEIAQHDPNSRDNKLRYYQNTITNITMTLKVTI